MKETVLIVEDDCMSAEFLKLFLEGEGYAVSTAHSQMEAEDLLSRSSPNILITDIMLSGGDGSKVARLCRENSDCRIIGISGLDSARLSLMKFDMSGFDKLLIKPIDFTDLLTALKCK